MTKAFRMPQSLRIEPIQEDIVRGTCDHPTKCMYALCLRRMFPSATYVSVNPNCISITIYGMYYHYTVPLKAVKNIADYDDTKIVDLRKAAVTATLAGVRICKYQSTDAVKKYHRERTARKRANPDYVRPESKVTLRRLLSKGRKQKLTMEQSGDDKRRQNP